MFPWVPLRTEIQPHTTVGPARYQSRSWQVVEERITGGSIVLLRSDGDPAWQAERQLAIVRAGRRHAALPEFGLDAVVMTDGLGLPKPLRALALRYPSLSSEELKILAVAIPEIRARRPTVDLESALFLVDLGICIGDTDAAEANLLELAQALVTGGVRSPRLSPPQMQAMNPWLCESEIRDFFDSLGPSDRAAPRIAPKSPPEKQFHLPGRPALERLFQEEIIDYWRSRERYNAMGVSPPGGLLLHGPPGTGKSHSIAALAAYLGWPLFEVGSVTVGSSFAHETPRAINNLFNEAAKRAPALVLLEEIDALGLNRQSASSDFRREEVATLLREVEAAPARGILVVATTNDLPAVDAAFLRPGRFEHVVQVTYPDIEEVRAALDAILNDRPKVAGIDVASIAKRLAHRSLAETRWLVDRAARIAVSEGKDAIDELCLQRAMRMLAEKFGGTWS